MKISSQSHPAPERFQSTAADGRRGHSRGRYLLPLWAGGYAVLFLGILWAAYSNRLPLAWLSQFPGYDKVGHVVLYCIPTYLGHCLCGCKSWRVSGRALPVFPALFTLFTVSEELLQGWSPYRTLDGGDLICSMLGIAIGYGLAQRSLSPQSSQR